MKVLHIGQMIGGLDIYIRNTITYADGDIEYIIVHGEDDKSREVVRNGKPVKEYGIAMYRALNPWRDLKSLLQAIRIIWTEKPDLIHCHSAKGGVIGRLAGFLTGTKTLYTPHAFSFLSASSPLKRNIFLFLERIMKFNSYLLACSDSERELGISKVHYSVNHALVWNNAVPDAANIIHNE